MTERLNSLLTSLTNPHFNEPDRPLPAEVAEVLAQARRVTTPCGSGELVWHVWGEQGANPALAPVLLCHGGSGSWTHWLRNILPLVAAGRRVLAPDLPGFGDSAVPPGGGDCDAIPEPLAQGLQQLLPDRACAAVGFSFGGLVAGLLAQRFPACVAQLVLVGAPGFGILPSVPFSLKGWRHLPSQAQRDEVHRHNLLALMLHEPAAVTPLALRIQDLNASRDRMPGRRLARTDILARAMADLACPVHGVFGDQDPFYKDQAALYEAPLQQAPKFKGLHGIAGAGHWVQFENAPAFNALLLDLLKA